jgi:outer membrane protein OmpA-like peptidoglycan-associated protein
MKSIFSLLFLLAILPCLAQITLNPKAGMQNLSYLNITKVEITDQYTLVDMHYVAPYNDSSWACANRQFYIKGIYQTMRKRLISAKGIPICDRKKWFTQRGQFINFQLIFPKLEAGIEEIDVIEGYGPNQFNFYNVLINNPLKEKQENKETPIEESKPIVVVPKKTTPTKQATTSTKTGTKTSTKTGTKTAGTTTKKSSVANNKTTNKTTNKADTTKITTKTSTEKPKLVFGTQKVGLKDSVAVRINFDKASDVIKTESLPEMEKLLAFLDKNPSVVIELTGHTEADEKTYTAKQRASNLQLSIDRIASVKSYLLTKGVASHRIQTKAYGGARPISAEAAINRRVMMRILRY